MGLRFRLGFKKGSGLVVGRIGCVCELVSCLVRGWDVLLFHMYTRNHSCHIFARTVLVPWLSSRWNTGNSLMLTLLSIVQIDYTTLTQKYLAE